MSEAVEVTGGGPVSAIDRFRWEIERLSAERDALLVLLEEAARGAVDLAAHLNGAASAYDKYAMRHRSVGRASADPFFTTRSADFVNAAERATAFAQRLSRLNEDKP
jgi:hypothetical protein